MTLLLGVAVGLTLGLTGAGGSIVAVPLLMLALGWSLPQAAPVALLAVAAAAALGTWVAWDKAYVRYRAAMLMGVLGAAVAPLGMRAAHAAPTSLLAGAFAVLMLYVAVRMFRQARRAPGEAAVVRATVAGDALAARGPVCRLDRSTGRLLWTRPCAAVLAGIGAGAGFLAGLLGVGGGFVIVPGLRTATELSMHSAVATSLMTIAITAGGAVALAQLGGVALPWAAALPFVGGALAGMVAERRIAPRVAGPRLQQGFAVLTGIAGLGMLAGTLH
jgi:uncharacterized protein